VREERKVMGTGHLLETQSASFLCPRNRAILLRTVVALAHQVDHRNPANHARFPACPLTKQLWDFLLEYDGGCKRGARRFGLSSSGSEISFAKESQKSGCSNYCLCDLACWCCLAG